MPSPWFMLIPIVWLAFAFFARWILDNPREEVDAGIMWNICRRYARTMQRTRYVGLENLPATRHPGPLIVLSNHPSGIDPVLLTGACRFNTRWIMAKDMRYPLAEPFWKFADVIMVDRKKRDASGTREAIKHITGGGAVGIFPEGGIERPAGTLRPFQPGVGLLIRRTGAPVLPVIIRGTPYSEDVWKSFWTRGRVVMEFKPLIRYTANESAEDIAADLQRRYEEWTGWPVKEPEAEET
jgi:1-acyl-sn-glycerol-3-phosphate acyltransferase